MSDESWIDVAGDSDVNVLCKQMTEIEQEMIELHEKIRALAEALNTSK